VAVSDRFLAFVVDQLGEFGPVTSKRMFGGAGLYSGDLFFALLDDGRLYFKVDDSNRGEFEAAGMGPFRPTGEGGEVMQYYEVPVEVLEDATALARWARKAVTVAASARARKNRKTRPVRVR
jgi:DNA transformation protein